MRVSHKLVWIIFVCLGLLEVRAQYRFDSWTPDDGLPQNSVYSIVQTRDGYIWLATVDGLARFDGVRFSIFNKSNSPGIVNNRFINLFEAADGDLWAGTEESGAARFHDGRFSTYGVGEGVPRIVSWIETDADGAVILHNDNQTIRFSEGKSSPFETQSNFSRPPRAVRSSNIKIFHRADDDNKFTECFIDGRWLSFSFSDGSPKLKIIAAAQEANGSVWLITDEGRVARAENGQVVRVFDERDGLPKYPLYFMTGSRLGLVAKDADSSLWLVDLPSMRRELLLKKAAVLPPLDRAEILSTYQDAEGNLWFGTVRNGLFRARKQVITAYSEPDGIADKNVYPIYQDRAGTIWVGTTNGLFKHENGSFTLIESTKGFLVNAIGEDPLGRILISDSGTLYVEENNQFVPFARAKIPVQAWIYAIHADRENAVWLGGDEGLSRFKDGVLRNFTAADGLAGNNVKVIIEARAGGLWIGTYDGLTRLQNGQLTSWREADGLPSRTVRSLYEDADGTLWIGSYDGGLARFKDGKFTHYNSNVGLYNDGAFQILEDGIGWFWISSNRGIYRVNRNELNEFADGKRSSITSIGYGKSDGMLNAECNGGRSPGGVKTADGRLWFPTQDGVAVIDPETVVSNPQPPPVVVEDIKVDNQSVPFETIDSAIRNPESAIQIEPQRQNFEIQYTALSFINSENLRFKYKLEGFDNNWVDAGTRRTAYFSQLPPGEYVFRVIAANSDGVWNETGKTLNIVVLPPFYRTWWFIGLTILSLGLIGFALYQRHVSGLKRKHAAQEEFSRRLMNAHESERRRVAAELHDSIGQSLAIIKNQAVFGAQATDDLESAKKQFDSISNQSAQAISEVREISYNLRPYLLDRLGLTKAIRSMLNKISEVGAMDVHSEIDDVDGIFPPETEISIYRILQESFNNILKHSEASEAKVSINKNGHVVSIRIEDNGRGFDTRASQYDVHATRAGEKTGFGLLGMAERIRMLGGKHSIESEIGKGTVIKIDLTNNTNVPL